MSAKDEREEADLLRALSSTSASREECRVRLGEIDPISSVDFFRDDDDDQVSKIKLESSKAAGNRIFQFLKIKADFRPFGGCRAGSCLPVLARCLPNSEENGDGQTSKRGGWERRREKL